MQNLSIEDFHHVAGENVAKIVGNTQQPPSEEFKALRRLCKRLEEKVNIQTWHMEMGTDSGEEDVPYPGALMAFKPSMKLTTSSKIFL